MIKLKKAISILLVILCLLSISSLINCKMSVKASPNVIHVGIPTGYSTIQEAINNATSGDTVFVHNGTYNENVVINKSLSLVGEDVNFTIINGYKNDSVILIVANDVNFSGFTIKESGINPYHSAIRVEYSSGIIIAYNKMISNTNGIGLFSSSGNVFSDNTISNNYVGVYLYSSSGNVFSDNTISNNYVGVYLHSSSGNVFSDNTISNNNLQGTYLTFSSNNVFYSNNFNNTNQVMSDLTNFWNYSGVGNYWSDYTGRDINGDGIGDNPYVINVHNQDNCPLMGVFSVFDVALNGEMYHVSFISNSTTSDFNFTIGAETGNRIIRFNVTGEDSTVGFCRVTIPTRLMNYPFIVLVDEEEIIPTLLDVSNETHVHLYFTYILSSHTVTIISSKTLLLYNELLDKYARLQIDFYNMNATYYDLLNNYSSLLDNHTMLQENYRELNNSYQEHLSNYSKNMHNIQNLMYIFAATTAIFLITTIYLSKHAHVSLPTKTKELKDDK